MQKTRLKLILAFREANGRISKGELLSVEDRDKIIVTRLSNRVPTLISCDDIVDEEFTFSSKENGAELIQS